MWQRQSAAGDGGSGRSHAIDEEARHDAGSDQPVVTLMTELLTATRPPTLLVSFCGLRMCGVCSSASAVIASQPKASQKASPSSSSMTFAYCD